MSSKKGWVRLHRSIRQHWLYRERRVFSRYEAFVDLILCANHTREKINLMGDLITVQRGQTLTSIRNLASAWGWSRNRVRRFLRTLEGDGMCTLQRTRHGTVVTLCNYDKYQGSENNSEPTSEPSDGHQTDPLADPLADPKQECIKELKEGGEKSAHARARRTPPI